MKLLNELITETYIRDEIKNFKKSKIKFNDKHKQKIADDVITIFTELNKMLKQSFNNTVVNKDVFFKQIIGNSIKKELIFVVDINGKEKVIETSFKEKDLSTIVKDVKSSMSININEFDDKIHKNNKLLIFLDFEEIVESLIEYINNFNKIDVVII